MHQQFDPPFVSHSAWHLFLQQVSRMLQLASFFVMHTPNVCSWCMCTNWMNLNDIWVQCFCEVTSEQLHNVEIKLTTIKDCCLCSAHSLLLPGKGLLSFGHAAQTPPLTNGLLLLEHVQHLLLFGVWHCDSWLHALVWVCIWETKLHAMILGAGTTRGNTIEPGPFDGAARSLSQS